MSDKNYEHPEFLMYSRLVALRKQYPKIKELDDLVKDLRKMINENSMSLVRSAHLYALYGQDDELTPKTRKMMKHMLQAALDTMHDYEGRNRPGRTSKK